MEKQILNFRIKGKVYESESTGDLVSRLSEHIQHLSWNELKVLKVVAENHESVALMILQPLMICKIGVAILLQNWLYVHFPGNFLKILVRAYTYSSVVITKLQTPFRNYSKFVWSKIESSLSKKKV